MIQLRRVAIAGDNHIPFARSNTMYTTAGNQEMLISILEDLVRRYNLHGEHFGEVVVGAVLEHSRDFNLTRECVFGSYLAPETPAYDIQQVCGTGLGAMILVANKITLGQTDSGITSDVDTTSDALIGVNEGLRKILLEANHGKGNLDKLKNLLKIYSRHMVPAISHNGEPCTGLSMGKLHELMAQTWQIPRDEQDRLAFENHHKLATAYEEGQQNDLMTPFRGLTRDQNLRPDIDLEKIGTLKPVFERGPRDTLMVANLTPLADGVSVVLLANEEWVKARGLSILAYFKDSETMAVNLIDRQKGLLIAPVYAVPWPLACNGPSLWDSDYYGVHEAFATQVLCTLKAWEDPKYCKARLDLDQPLGSINRSKLNAKGSSSVADYPFTATGGRVVADLAKLLSVAEQGHGLISIYAAGGQGVTTIIEWQSNRASGLIARRCKQLRDLDDAVRTGLSSFCQCPMVRVRGGDEGMDPDAYRITPVQSSRRTSAIAVLPSQAYRLATDEGDGEGH